GPAGAEVRLPHRALPGLREGRPGGAEGHPRPRVAPGLSGRRAALGAWDPEPDEGSPRRAGVHLQRSSVPLRDAGAEREPEPAPARFGGDARLEHPRAFLRRDARTRVLHLEYGSVSLGPGTDRHLASGGHGFLGVPEEVVQQLRELIPVGLDRQRWTRLPAE